MTELVPRTEDGMRYTTARSPHWMLNQLPVGMLESEFFVRFVCIFQELGETLFADADNVDNLLDLSVAPLPVVRWLGSWIGVDEIDASLPDDLQRRIVKSMAKTVAWRGTARGLRRFLELVSGGAVEVEDGGGVWRAGEAPQDTAWVRLRVASTGWLSEADFVSLVRDEVPAHVRADLIVDGRQVWSSDAEEAR
jgi:phage tail-like protein